MESLIFFLKSFFLSANPLIFIFVLILILIFVLEIKKYRNSTYYQVTKFPYFSVKFNTGRYGEYLIYRYLKNNETTGAKFLFNLFIPKGNGETSEIDVLMICPEGIFVFESKNYSGWIFGSENQKNWHQTLPAGRGKIRKEQFYNPIMQNRSHIKYLRNYVNDEFTVWSIIVFSERCTLKSIETLSTDVHVIKRNNIASVVTGIRKQPQTTKKLNQNTIDNIYSTLFPFTQVDENVKSKHIIDIQNNLKPTADPIHTTTALPAFSNAGTTDTEPADIVEPQQPADASSFQSHGTASSPSSEFILPDSISLKCPRCNGKLVLRTAVRGTHSGKQFYGCSNFPKCKYLKNI